MKKLIPLNVQDNIHEFVWNVWRVIKVILYEVLIALVVMGILYCLNFKVTIIKNVQVISPIQEVK